jgi:SAM-dependent methyltransferase
MAHPNEQLLRNTLPNAEQRELWTGIGFAVYSRETDRIEDINGPFGEVMLREARLESGERVLDVGCGAGSTTVEAARRVARAGSVLGIDISAPMLDLARRRAGADNVDFVEGDAQVHPFEDATFDAVISRFGIMFCEDPQAAFANLCRALRPGGRLVFVCPQDPFTSVWVTVAFAAAAPHVGIPDLGAPGSPGPFAFADGERLTRIVTAGGFRDVTLQALTKPIRLANDVDDVVGFITSLPVSQQLFAGKPADKVTAAVDALRESLTPYARPEGVVMNDTAWLASAHR